MRDKERGTSNVVQAMKVQGQFENKGSFGTSNESEQGMREKERGTSNVVQGMKVQGQFRNKGSFGIRAFFEQGLWSLFFPFCNFMGSDTMKIGFPVEF